jgi:hypothetical protein
MVERADRPGRISERAGVEWRHCWRVPETLMPFGNKVPDRTGHYPQHQQKEKKGEGRGTCSPYIHHVTDWHGSVDR